jgi:hypothetical protein
VDARRPEELRWRRTQTEARRLSSPAPRAVARGWRAVPLRFASVASSDASRVKDTTTARHPRPHTQPVRAEVPRD